MQRRKARSARWGNLLQLPMRKERNGREEIQTNKFPTWQQRASIVSAQRRKKRMKGRRSGQDDNRSEWQEVARLPRRWGEWKCEEKKRREKNYQSSARDRRKRQPWRQERNAAPLEGADLPLDFFPFFPFCLPLYACVVCWFDWLSVLYIFSIFPGRFNTMTSI